MKKYIGKKLMMIDRQGLREEKQNLKHLLRYWKRMQTEFPANAGYIEEEIRRVKEKMEKIDCQISK